MKVFGEFRYYPSAGRVREIGILVEESASGALSFECPCCGKRGRLNPRPRHIENRAGRAITIPGHRVTVASAGKVTISRRVICPNLICGWSVRVSRGVAKDASSTDDALPNLPTTPYVEVSVMTEPEVPRKAEGRILQLAGSVEYRETMELF